MDEQHPATRHVWLKYDSRCAGCGEDLRKATSAWWSRRLSKVWCDVCHGSTAEAPNPPPPAPTPDPGHAGLSAQREHDRRRARFESQIRSAYPRFGSLILALRNEPQTTRSWGRGAEGERQVAHSLEKLRRDDVRALHDRRIPPTRNNIDHIVLGPSGVHVVDAKAYAGAVSVRNVGNLFRRDMRLYVGRRECGRAVAGVLWQADRVVTVLAAAGHADVPVHPVLCLVDAEWPLFGSPGEFGGVRLEGRRSLRNLVSRPGPLEPAAIERLTAVLAAAFPPA